MVGQHLGNGSRVRLARLHAEGMNGLYGTVLGRAGGGGENGRIMVSLDSGKTVKVKPRNLDPAPLADKRGDALAIADEIPVGSLVRLINIKDPALNGERGLVSGHLNGGERVVVTLDAGPVKVKPINLEVLNDGPPPEGARVCIVRLQDPKLNNKCGVVSGIASGGERVIVTLDSGPIVKVKPNNLDPEEEDYESEDYESEDYESENYESEDYEERENDEEANGSKHLSDETSDTSEEDDLVFALEEADEMFDQANTSGNETISKKEFELYMKRHTDTRGATINELFAMIDADNSGTITREEVHRMYIRSKKMQIAGMKDNEPMDLKSSIIEAEETSNMEIVFRCLYDADRLFLLADTDGDGNLTKKEFVTYMDKNTKHNLKAINSMFELIDADKDGQITIEEVREAHMRYGKGDGKLGMHTTMGELLGLDNDELHPLPDDVYNMFFLSPICSRAFFYTSIIFGIKISLFILLECDLLRKIDFPKPGEVKAIMKLAQFLLLPVAVAIQEEIITTFFVYGNLQWSPGILELNPGAKQWKYHMSNILRFADGVLYVICNLTLLFQANEGIQSMFLNFTALDFVSTVDNVALQLARDGYLGDGLEGVARNVEMMKLPRNSNETLHKMDTVMIILFFVISIVIWFWIHFVGWNP